MAASYSASKAEFLATEQPPTLSRNVGGMANYFTSRGQSGASFTHWNIKSSLSNRRFNSAHGGSSTALQKPAMTNLLQKKPSVEESGCSTISSNSNNCDEDIPGVVIEQTDMTPMMANED